MSRNLDNLKRLFRKLQVRYGTDDATVLQVKQALESREAFEAKHSWWFAPRHERRSGKSPGRRFGSMSGG